MKNLYKTCLSLLVLCGNVNCFSEYIANEPYKYNTDTSRQSKIVNESLKSDVVKLLNQLKTENKVFTAQERRLFANKFFMEHSISVKINGEIKDFTIENTKDKYEIPVRLYTPQKNSDRLILFIHGGGWSQGNLDTHDYLCRKMVNILGCKVLAVDYRLAPEHEFPIGLEDVQSVYKWCFGTDSKQVLGDISQIYISGGSAGGNLSATLNLSLKRDGNTKHFPDGLLLFYPVLSDKMDTSSFKIFKDQAALTAASTIAFMGQYIGAKISDPETYRNEKIFPINGDASLFPKTLMIAAGCDVLLDGQIELFTKLKDAKIPVNLLIEDGAVHGFMTYGKEFDKDIEGLLQKVKEWLSISY